MSEDLISRQAAIDAIKHHQDAVLGEREYDEGIAYGYAAAQGISLMLSKNCHPHSQIIKKY